MNETGKSRGLTDALHEGTLAEPAVLIAHSNGELLDRIAFGGYDNGKKKPIPFGVSLTLVGCAGEEGETSSLGQPLCDPEYLDQTAMDAADPDSGYDAVLLEFSHDGFTLAEKLRAEGFTGKIAMSGCAATIEDMPPATRTAMQKLEIMGPFEDALIFQNDPGLSALRALRDAAGKGSGMAVGG